MGLSPGPCLFLASFGRSARRDAMDEVAHKCLVEVEIGTYHVLDGNYKAMHHGLDGNYKETHTRSSMSVRGGGSLPPRLTVSLTNPGVSVERHNLLVQFHPFPCP